MTAFNGRWRQASISRRVARHLPLSRHLLSFARPKSKRIQRLGLLPLPVFRLYQSCRPGTRPCQTRLSGLPTSSSASMAKKATGSMNPLAAILAVLPGWASHLGRDSTHFQDAAGELYDAAGAEIGRRIRWDAQKERAAQDKGSADTIRGGGRAGGRGDGARHTDGTSKCATGGEGEEKDASGGGDTATRPKMRATGAVRLRTETPTKTPTPQPAVAL